MNKWKILILLGCFLQCRGREPFKPKKGSLPFLVYYASRYRGICVGTLVSRTAVLTAAVCITNPTAKIQDTRAINVVTGATYRHPRRGIRVQVHKILIPNVLHLAQENNFYMMQKSPAILLLKRKVPDVLAEVPLRSLNVDYKGEETITMQEECMMPGWHFFYKGDKIYPIHKFLLQRNVRVQFLNVVKKTLWCDALTLKFRKALHSLGYGGFIDKTASFCLRDPDRTAQPCHGMYGAPLICNGRAVGMLMAPDAQWTNCTGFSNIVHIFSSRWLLKFMSCVSRLFEVDAEKLDWSNLKQAMYDNIDDTYDYVPSLYDKLGSSSSSSSGETIDDP